MSALSYDDFNRNMFSYGGEDIVEGRVSDSIASFHNINQTQLPEIEYFIYQVNLFGVPLISQDVLPQKVKIKDFEG